MKVLQSSDTHRQNNIETSFRSLNAHFRKKLRWVFFANFFKSHNFVDEIVRFVYNMIKERFIDHK